MADISSFLSGHDIQHGKAPLHPPTHYAAVAERSVIVETQDEQTKCERHTRRGLRKGNKGKKWLRLGVGVMGVGVSRLVIKFERRNVLAKVSG